MKKQSVILGKKFGYARVSSDSQSIEVQIKLLTEEGVTTQDIYFETISSRVKLLEREQLQKVLSLMQKGDILIATKADRIARSNIELLQIIELLEQKGCYIKILDTHIDTTTKIGKTILEILGSIAQLERDVIAERTKEGIELAKEKGIYKGGWIKFNVEEIKDIKSLHKHGLSLRKIAKVYKSSPTTIHRYIKCDINKLDFSMLRVEKRQ